MPFEVFRRHQKKMLAVLAIMAMVAFTLDFSLFKSGWGRGTNDPVVVTLYNKPVRRSDVQLMQLQRSRANRLIGRLLFDMPEYPIFGPLNTRAIVDAMILEHEAERLGMPANVKLAKEWLRNITQNKITSEQFDMVYRASFSSDEVTEEGLLSDLARQIRILSTSELAGSPLTTPLDVYQAYRDQNERVSASAIEFPVSEYVSKVKDPSEAEITAFYDKYKNVLPDPKRDMPGFTIPRRVRAEFVMLDGAAVAKALKQKLTEKELRKEFEAREKELPIPPRDLPTNLFAGDPEAKLTPHDPFPGMRSYVENLLAEERAREKIDKVLESVKDDVMTPFYEKYAAVLDENKELKKATPLPDPGDLLRNAAAKIEVEGTKAEYEATKPLDREEADHVFIISGARVGVSPSSDGQKFVDRIFDDRAPLFDPIDLADAIDRRFLAWKTEDAPMRIPSLSEIRSEVVQAWKLEQARPLARKDAESVAEEARKKSGDLIAVAGKHKLITTESVTRLQPSPPLNGTSRFSTPRPSEIPSIPNAGEALRDALFGLKDKAVVVAANQSKDRYYVMALSQRSPVELGRLLDFGPYMGLRTEVGQEAASRRRIAWMTALRSEAGLASDWKPADESRTEQAPTEE
jgi:hypothetical protein